MINYIVDKAMEITPLQWKPFMPHRNDCFCVAYDKKRLLNVRKFKQYIHPNIAFTTEMQSNNRLRFLDVQVDNSGPNQEPSTFCKPARTQNGTDLYLEDLQRTSTIVY